MPSGRVSSAGNATTTDAPDEGAAGPVTKVPNATMNSPGMPSGRLVDPTVGHELNRRYCAIHAFILYGMHLPAHATVWALR